MPQNFQGGWQIVIETALNEATDVLLELAEIATGDDVIDVAAGAGWQSIAAAKRVGRSGSVLATDISAELLEAGIQFAKAAGIDNIQARQMPAENLLLPDESFDAAICRNGLMHFNDHRRAVSEVWRVLKHSARFSVAVWAVAEENEFISVPISMASQLCTTEALHYSDPFAFGSPNALRAALEDGGFQEIAVRPIHAHFDFSSAKEAARFQVERNMVLKQIISQMDLSQRATIPGSLERAYAAFETQRGFYAPCSLLVAAGTKR